MLTISSRYRITFYSPYFLKLYGTCTGKFCYHLVLAVLWFSLSITLLNVACQILCNFFFWRIYFLGIQIEFFYMTEPVMSKRIWVKLGVEMNSMTWDFHFMESLFHLVYGCRFALCQIFCCLVLLSFCMFIPEYEIVVWSIMCSSKRKFNSKFCLHVSFDVTFLFLQVYSTSVAMLLTAVVSVFLFGFHLSLAFFLGSTWDLMFFLICYPFFFSFQ